jgi:undecaprenyl phosphate-alpha-L-ara4N flippase subunit ArnE
MSPKLMIWISVVLSAIAQIFLKKGLSNVKPTGLTRGVGGLVLRVATESWIWLWGLSFLLATILWLLGLQKLDLSYAYPLVSLGYVLVNILSAIFFNERVDRNRWAAVVIIAMGVMLIAGT